MEWFLTPQGIQAAKELGIFTTLLFIIAFGMWWIFKDERVAGRTKQILLDANERLAEEVRETRAEVRTLHVQLAESETARTNDRMELETRLEHIKEDLAEARERAEAMEAQNEAMKAQNEAMKAQMDEALKRLAQAECQRDEIAAKSHAEKQQFETTIQRLSVEVEQLRELVARLQAPGVEAPGLTD